MKLDELHPVARDVLAAFAPHGYFRSVRLCQAIADRDPIRCLSWSFSLVEPLVCQSTPHAVVVETLKFVKSAMKSPDARNLPVLDDLAWQCWSSGIFDNNHPLLQRAVARLAWAAIGLVCVVTSSKFTSERVARSIDAGDGAGLLVHQCAMAIDMSYTETQDGRLMIAAEFTRQMESLP